jgi:aldehyde dehydrogenase (NAD+)
MDIDNRLKAMRIYFDEGHTRSYEFRKAQLENLIAAVKSHEQEIMDALWKDLHKNRTEAYYSEIGLVLEEANYALNNLRNWMKPERPASPLIIQPSSSYIYHQPKGVVLIISPWNYPFMLSLSPLVAAIAAGNCAVLKPSEETPHVSALIEKLISQTFADNYISVVAGPGKETVAALTESFQFNHIFFTGSPAVGKIIGGIAASQLSSCTLELGGKSPGIVDSSANIKIAARRLVWGKFTNAGQTCVAPDYLLLHESVKDEFIREAIISIKAFYGDDARLSADYGRLVNSKRFKVVASYLNHGKILYGGATDEKTLYIEPTIMQPAGTDTALMEEEIFGPVWPVLTWKNRDNLLDIFRKNRYPLACYYFGSDKVTESFIIDRFEFGGGCVNNALAHLGNSELPFGGVQSSGTGNYHGKFGFLCFSNAKAIVKSTNWPDPSLRYAPYSKSKLGWFKKLLG